MSATLKYIGHIKTPYEAIEDCPNNIDFNGPLCQLVLDAEFRKGLTGLLPRQNILILYWFENTDRNEIETESDTDEGLIGTFSLRSPNRPNPIVAATLPIESIENGVVSVRGLDCLNGTPLLDIKPAIILEAGGENT
ncbi:MAG: SAM-dependent methyltransferase [Candidatus Thiodiazotropha sp. (ex Lucinoma borealis)]|nr:SAM-dependent methyltransferase [Candidatus Thiodiazotropha sp. (ex Lucinoma borealis)]